MKRCPKCKIEPMTFYGNNYCPKCGTELEEIPESQWRCDNQDCCMFNNGRIFLKYHKYCGNCGLPLVLIED